MTARVLDGTATAAAIKGELTGRVALLRERGVVPGLGTVLVGDDPASKWYVAGKHRDCAEVGIASIQRELPDTVSQAELEAEIDELNADDAKGVGIDVLTGGTDVHLVLVDLRNAEVDGKQAEDLLHQVGITVNRNAVPFDPRPPMVTSGVRIGTPALATRGFGDEEFAEVADIIVAALKPSPELEPLRSRVRALADRFPLYPTLGR